MPNDLPISESIRELEGHAAVVTGASSGIGRAIAIALARYGASVCLLGRDPVRLSETVKALDCERPHYIREVDLSIDREMHEIPAYIQRAFGRLDVLVHSAATIHLTKMQESQIEQFDLQYQINVRAPYLLTQRLLPLLKASQGEIVFINSSVGVSAKRPDVGQYAATKHALRAVADSLRAEVNQFGVRVLSIYPGRTATPAQKALYASAGVQYHPEVLLQPEDVAEAIVRAILMPRTAEITDLHIRPMNKSQ